MTFYVHGNCRVSVFNNAFSRKRGFMYFFLQTLFLGGVCAQVPDEDRMTHILGGVGERKVSRTVLHSGKEKHL